MSELIHTTRVRIEQLKPPLRHAYIEEFSEPVPYGVHGRIKDFYGLEPDEDVPATLDHIVAAVAGWMAGTLAGALEVRGIPAHPDKLKTTVEGDIRDVEGKPVVTDIRIKYHLTIPQGLKEKADRALGRHKERCAASTSVERGISVSWEAEVVEE